MVGEHSVGVKVAASACVGAQNFKYLVRVKAARAVACVNNNMKAPERVLVILGVYFFFDLLAQTLGVVFHVIAVGYAAAALFLGALAVLGVFENRLYVAALKSALACKEFKSVSIIWVMAGGDLQRAVAAQIDRGHKHGRSRSQSAAKNLSACSLESGGSELHNVRARYSAVASHRDFKLIGSFSDLF